MKWFSQKFTRKNFKYTSQEFDNELLELVKLNVFYSCEDMYSVQKFNEGLPNKVIF